MAFIKYYVILAVVVAIVCVSVYITKSELYKIPHTSKSLYISKLLKSDIEEAVRKSKIITALQIVTIDFKNNIRIETYASIDNFVLQKFYDKFINSKVVETPFFTSDKYTNDRAIRLIQGEFVCVPFENSTAYKYVPDAAAYVKYVCGIAVPPHHYNNFSGILTLYLNEVPIKTEQDELFAFARNISIRVIEDNENYIQRGVE